MGMSLWLRARSRLSASLTNSEVTMRTVGLPCSLTLIVSWTLHAVQEPQAARPTATASTLSTKSDSSFAPAASVWLRLVG